MKLLKSKVQRHQNRIEGIITTDDRLKMIVKEKTMPRPEVKKKLLVIEMSLQRYMRVMNIFQSDQI